MQRLFFLAIAEGHSSLKGLIWISRLNVVAVVYAVAANVVQCCSFDVGRALDAAKILKLCIKRSKKVPWQTDIKQIFRQNLTEEFKYVAFILKLFWWMSINTNKINCVGINFVLPRVPGQGYLGQMC